MLTPLGAVNTQPQTRGWAAARRQTSNHPRRTGPNADRAGPDGRGIRADRPDDAGPAAPRVVQVSAALGWRLPVVVAALYVIGIAVTYLAAVVVPVGSRCCLPPAVPRSALAARPPRARGIAQLW
jgi:hypothetical protein